ncbi:MAG: hypothetical protein WB341_03130 [Terracidiphilus sp.]
MATNFLTATSTTPTSWSACTGTCNEPGNEVQVTVSYGFPLAIPYWKATTITFSSTGTMVIAQ